MTKPMLTAFFGILICLNLFGLITFALNPIWPAFAATLAILVGTAILAACGVALHVDNASRGSNAIAAAAGDRPL